MKRTWSTKSSPQLIRKKCMRVVTCTKHYYRKHGKWPTTRQLAENYKGVRSDGLWWSSWSWWRSWEEEAVAQGLLTVGKQATPEKNQKDHHQEN